MAELMKPTRKPPVTPVNAENVRYVRLTRAARWAAPTFRNRPSIAVCCHQFIDDRIELIWPEPLNWFSLGPDFQDVGGTLR